jgi:hypothetical protein
MKEDGFVGSFKKRHAVAAIEEIFNLDASENKAHEYTKAKLEMRKAGVRFCLL